METMVGRFARSLAGHDKGRLYVITAQKDGILYLCDGKVRTMSRPKKKKRRHIQPRGALPPKLRERLIKEETVYDHEIKYAIKQYEGKEEANV